MEKEFKFTIAKSWENELKDVLGSDDFKRLYSFLGKEYLNKNVLPDPKVIFRALNLVALDQVKVVILGQDPYPRESEADGLCFSINKGFNIPAGLRNIFKEVRDELGRDSACLKVAEGSLLGWAEQGVLLLNSILTVEEGKPSSHQNIGWESFTDKVIKKISDKGGVVFMLWGAKAKQKELLIDANKNLVLKANHPSQPSRTGAFAGNGHFKKANEWLKKNGEKEVIW